MAWAGGRELGENDLRIDTERQRATPEGVTLGLRVAGPFARGLAWLFDLMLIFVALFVVLLAASLLGNFGAGLAMVLIFLVYWGYPVAFEVLRRGATPGKTILGLEVVHDDGTPVGPRASVLRNLLRFADFLPFAWGFGLMSMLLSGSFQRLGDLAAGTVVVYRNSAGTDLPDLPNETPIPPPVGLDRQEQRALIDYATRVPTWTGERAVELADLVVPLTGAEGTQGVRKLVGMAAWLIGRRGTSA